MTAGGPLPRHVDGLDGTKMVEGLSYNILAKFKVDAANIYSGRKEERC